MPYVVTLLEKRAESDHAGRGADPATSRIVLDGDELGPWSAPTLALAVADAFGAFGLPLDYFFTSDTGDDVETVSCNRLETGDSEIPDAATMARFEAGETTLWLCDYSFGVAYREDRPITIAELRAAFPAAQIG